MYNGICSSIINSAIPPDNGPFFDDPGTGCTGIYGPSVDAVAMAPPPQHEQLVVGRIPITELRACRRQPALRMELYRDIYENCTSQYPSNLWTEYLQTLLEDAGRYVRDTSRWK